MALLPVSNSVEVQLRWLEEQQPDYLQTFPSNLAELARLALARDTRLARLREAWTVGEIVTPELRALCRDAWGVKVVDAYTTEEVGYLGLQCPDHEHYHVQSEFIAVEVIDTRGKPCRPGQVGPVVVTPLHNFAMPLVRYVLGDYAEAGPACACGRGLPVLSRIMGRVRNMLVTASGQLYWPSFGTRRLTDIAPVLQHQLVQKDFDLIEVRLVTARILSPEEEQAIRRRILSRLPAPFEIRFVYLNEISRSASGKFEDFMSEVAARGAGLPGDGQS
jgi:phenylacetate-CoA ligase